MKNHFSKLFNYDHYANHIILEAIIKAGEPLRAVQTMGHLLVAQQIWFNRCNNLPPVAATLWDEDWKGADISSQIIDDNNNAWLTYVDMIPIGGFDEVIAYTNLKGESHENKLSDIITHVINHGTHHRGQIGQHLKLAGVNALPGTDFIAFVR